MLTAGFGGDDSKKKKEVKIKPKQQWDRYTELLKKEKPYRVAVKAEGKESDEWLEVGNVKSKDGEYTKAAVARQRALIAEVRLHVILLQVILFTMGAKLHKIVCSFVLCNSPSTFRVFLLLSSMHSTRKDYFRCKYLRRIRLSGHTGTETATMKIGLL